MIKLLLDAIRGSWRSDLQAMEKRIMATLDDLKAAEDKVGTDIATAIKINSDNVAKLQAALAAAVDPSPAIQALIDETVAHAQALESAFPAPAVAPPPPAPVPVDPASAGATAAPAPIATVIPGTPAPTAS